MLCPPVRYSISFPETPPLRRSQPGEAIGVPSGPHSTRACKRRSGVGEEGDGDKMRLSESQELSLGLRVWWGRRRCPCGIGGRVRGTKSEVRGPGDAKGGEVCTVWVFCGTGGQEFGRSGGAL